MDNFKIIISRFEAHLESGNYVVGFSLRCLSNNKARYFDTNVPILGSENLSQQEIAQIAWGQLSSQIDEWCNSVKDIPSILGAIFAPPAPAPEEPAPAPEEPEEPAPV
jgi:hypothetical protein